jgi:hypothetical protein
MSTRKDFIVAGTIAAATLPAAAGATTTKTKPANRRIMMPPKLDFDYEGYQELLDGAQAHKHLFTSVEIDGGEVFGAARNCLLGYESVGVAMSDVFPVVVLYHATGVLLGFNDDLWNRYVYPLAKKLPKGKGKELTDVIKPGVTGNPMMRSEPGPFDSSIPTLIAQAGLRIFMCNYATHGFASYIAEELGHSPEAVYADIARNLVPNAMLVPNGVWAIQTIQEHRFTILQTSLASPD